MIPTNGPSFARTAGRPRRYPGGSGNSNIFATVHRVDAKTTRRLAPADPFDPNRVTELRIQLHALHPPALCGHRKKASCRRIFTPAQPDDPAASVRDFVSGAYSRGLDEVLGLAAATVQGGGIEGARSRNAERDPEFLRAQKFRPQPR